jgi:hypothetical protein
MTGVRSQARTYGSPQGLNAVAHGGQISFDVPGQKERGGVGVVFPSPKIGNRLRNGQDDQSDFQDFGSYVMFL